MKAKALILWIHTYTQLIIKKEKTAHCQQHSPNNRSPFLDATHHGGHLLHSYEWERRSLSSCSRGGEPNPHRLGTLPWVRSEPDAPHTARRCC